MIRRILLFLLVFGATLIWRFPYEQAIADRISRLEAQTGIQLDYTPVKASASGVEWKDVHITTRSGAHADFEEAKLRPTWNGLSAFLAQKKGQLRLNTGSQGELVARMDRLELETGVADYGRVVLTGDLTHFLGRNKGEGALRVELPDYKLPLGVSDVVIEMGSKIFWQDRGHGYETRAEVTLVGGRDYHAEGNLAVDPQPGAPGMLNGNLAFRTPLKEGRLRVYGPWNQPQWSVLPK